MNNLKNKIVLITGASSGIGAATATLFAAQGAKLLLCARREEKLAELAEQLKQKNNNEIHYFALDVQKEKTVVEAIANLPAAWQAIDILVNNAGLAVGLDKLYETDFAAINTMIDTNIKGLMFMTRAVLPIMLARKQGHIINLGSIAGHEVYAGGSVYCATKFAVNGFNKALRKDLFATPIRVTSIDPGAVETEFSEVRFKGDKQRVASVYQGFTPLTPLDIADAILYCASRPAHVDVSEMVIMPTAQVCIDKIHREE